MEAKSIPPRHPTDVYWTCPGDEDRDFHAVSSFNETKLALRTCFHRSKFLPRQVAAINCAVGRYDLILSLPTSAGKSLCYQLPAILREDRLTVVISPTRALIEDQIKNLHSLGEDWKSWAIRSHSDNKQDPRRADRARIFYICPEWATSDQRNQTIFTNLCVEGKIARIIVDEAHQALRAPTQEEFINSSMHRHHRQAYAWVFQIRRDFPDIPFTLVSASTTDRDLRTLTDRFRMTGQCIRVASPLDRPNLHYRVVHVPKSVRNYRIRAIVSYIKNHPGDCGLVFVRTRKQAEDISQRLLECGINVDHFHGGQRERLHEILHKFHSGEVNVIVCTCAFGEGINKADVRFVFHYSIPPNIPSYFQETGRAGRDGLKSECILFYRFSDLRTIANIVAHDTPHRERELTPSQKDDLQRVLTYCNDSFSCRRTHILDPFEDDSVGNDWLRKLHGSKLELRDCDKCDVCEERSNRFESNWFEKIKENYLKAVDDAFRNDLELSVSILANRVCNAEGIRTTAKYAEDVIEYLVVAGYLTMDFSFRGRGFVVIVRPRSRANAVYRPIPIPYDIELEPAPSVVKPRQQRLFKPVQQAKPLDKKDLSGSDSSDGSDEEDDREDASSSDEETLDSEVGEMSRDHEAVRGISSEEEEQEEEDVTIVRPSRNRKRRHSAGSVEVEAAKRPRTDKSATEKFFKKFEDLVKMRNKAEQAELGRIRPKTLRSVFARWQFNNNADAFNEVLEEVNASEDEVDILKFWYEWIEEEVLHERWVVNGSPTKYHV